MTGSPWALAGVQAEAFAPRNATGWPEHWVARVTFLLALLTHERRVHPGGDAVCLLWARRWRCALSGGTVGFGTAMVAGSNREAGMGLVAISLVAGVWRWRRGGHLACWWIARRGTGQAVRVHSFASRRPGAGRELLVVVTEEADRKGWDLYLEPANARLGAYYGDFGFKTLPAGRPRPSCQRMWRPALRGDHSER